MIVGFMRMFFVLLLLQFFIGSGMAQINMTSVPLLSDPFGKLSETDIANVEKKMGFKFPADYRSFLILKNGGVFHDAVKADSKYTVSHFFGIRTGYNWSDLHKFSRVVDDWLPKSLFVIALGPGGDLFCIDVNSPSGSRVVFIRHEERTGVEVAKSFTQFCDSLTISDVQVRESHELSPMMQSIEARDIERFNSMIESGVDPNVQFENGETALMRAAWRCRSEMIDALIRKGADIELRDDAGKTAIFYAASAQSPSTVELLATTHGADINARDRAGKTALMFAVSTLSARTIKKLIECGADAQCKSDNGSTAATIFPNLPPEILSLLETPKEQLRGIDNLLAKVFPAELWSQFRPGVRKKGQEP